MQLIRSVAVDHFRSIRDDQKVEMDDFTTLAGLNNAGKSNLLRALNLFFTGKTDVGVDIDFASDYNRHDLKSKKSKEIRVAVNFNLPPHFKFRQGLDAAEGLLGREFTIEKIWAKQNQSPQSPKYRLNGQDANQDNVEKIIQFLGLINYRYIPNRVLPLDIIKSENEALRDAIIRRLGRRLKDDKKLFDKLNETSRKLLEEVSSYFKKTANIDSVSLNTPSTWQEFIFAFGYILETGNIEVEDYVQGSGIQSLLMLQTLVLIDKDYFQKFGWKQAAIWAIEEPESSMHTSLEAKVASFLSEVANEPDGRLQIIGTTHSDLMLQAANSIVTTKSLEGRTTFKNVDKKTGLLECAREGVSRFTHPLLVDPTAPAILVEGKYDYEFLDQAIRLLAPSSNIRVSYLEVLNNAGGATGGDSNLLKYLQENKQFIDFRMEDAPICVLLDWDAEKRMKGYQKCCNDESRYMVKIWPESTFNPALPEEFKGIERHMSDRIIKEADPTFKVIGTVSEGLTISEKNYKNKLKPAIYDVVKKGIEKDDLKHVESFVLELVNEIKA